jgi:peptidoglycan hydrolase-like protein with peptidoglycan-binding domain
VKDETPVKGPLRSRRRFLLGMAAGAGISSLAGLGASTFIKSPQQLAAEAKAPEASVLTAEVVRRVLVDTIVTRGKITPAKVVEVVPRVDAGSLPVVTRLPFPKGAKAKPGDVVLEISGRPVILLKGGLPAYRDMLPGISGRDVEQLQTALAALGLSIRDKRGVFGSSTQAAITRLYRDRGYPPPQGSPDGVFLPMGEVVFAGEEPVTVSQVKAGLGAESKGAVLVLAVGALAVRGLVRSTQSQLVQVGMPVTVLYEEAALSRPGKVAAIDAFQPGGGTDEAAEKADEILDGPGHPLTVTCAEPLPDELAGREVRVTIEIASSGTPVLSVPSSAVFATASGDTELIKVVGGVQSRIEVTTGASAGGYVEIKESRGQLVEGDKVVIGK